ncbi:hypothetical protein [Streptomyces sp. NPDC046759]|uniref:hypothetical protein n=1 Tax=Streptomyces sp. NPDC046759 TaxID=3155019 RepID=UPI0033C8D0E6
MSVTGLLQTAGGLLERRLLTTAWLPVVVFGALTGALTACGVGWSRSRHAWQDLPGDLRILTALTAVAVTALLAQLLAAVRPGLIRLYEGYWGCLPYGNRIADRLRRRHEDPVARAERPWSLPTPDRLMPTRFGNVIRAAEQQAQRYGMDAPTAWPRLYVALPETFTHHFAAACATLDLMVTISVLGAVFAVCGGVLAGAMLSWQAALLCAAGGALTCWLGFRAALRAAFAYGELVRAAFDVHRWLLLDAMGLRRPTSYAAELQQWHQLHQLWQRGRPDAGCAHRLGYPTTPPDAS